MVIKSKMHSRGFQVVLQTPDLPQPHVRKTTSLGRLGAQSVKQLPSDRVLESRRMSGSLLVRELASPSPSPLPLVCSLSLSL